MEKGLLEKTGKPLAHWIKVVEDSKLEKHKAIMDMLKQEHGLTHGFANFVALKARKADAASYDDTTLLDTQYKGKEALRPIYDQLIIVAKQLGSDVSIVPKKDSVSLVRKRQLALIKPATKTRIDLGLKLKDKPITPRLEASGPFGTMCTHRVRLSSVEEIDNELVSWLKEAYEKAAG